MFMRTRADCISGSSDMTIKMWDSNKGTCVVTKFANSGCLSLDISKSDSMVISGHRDGTVRLTNPKS